MKKILLVLAIFAVARLNAQIVNNSFELWSIDTSQFAGFSGVVAGDQGLTYSDPKGWTTTNSVTEDPALGGLTLVTQSNTAYVGSSSMQLTTDTLTTIVAQGLTKQLTVPGMALNGVFPVSSITSNFVSITGGSINPGKVSGAGQPFTQLLDSFTGYYQYTPVYDSAISSLDTCVMWATLRKGSTIIANAIFKSQDSTHGQWARFSAPFVYLNCETPDTLVVLLASSVPNFSGLLSGTSDLTMGSVLLVDDLGYDTLAAGSNFVFAKKDTVTVHRGVATSINVLANDTSCNGSALTVTISMQPHHGTATVLGNNEISYTGSVSYYGFDTLYYFDTDPNHASSAPVSLIIMVDYGVGISEANEIAVKMFPVPASDILHIQFANSGKTTARIFDVVGNLVSTATFTQNDDTINTGNLTNGIYSIQLLDENNTIIARTKFVVNK